jgi:hypothetical protein
VQTDLSSDVIAARDVPERHWLVPHELQAVADALAAVSQPASGEPAADTRGPDNNADCRIAHERSGRTLFADKRGAEIANFSAAMARPC